MRIPRVHRFVTTELPDELFRRLPDTNRFRFAAGHDAPTVFGAEPVRTVRHRPDRPDPKLYGDELRDALPRVPAAQRNLRFPGGAVGYVTYERGYGVEELALPRAVPTDPPELWFGVYDTFARWESGAVETVSWGLTEAGDFDESLALRRASALEERLRSGPGRTVAEPGAVSETRASLDRVGHARGIESILEAIARGDIYQANLTVRFEVDYQGPGVDLFERLLRDNPAPFGTFLEADGATVVSCSPERLLRVDGRRLEARPIKGTAPRSPDPSLDRSLARTLSESGKDRAELLMITDLLRNDLGKVCEYGSVRVPQLRKVESFPHVHHLVSTIRGLLRPDRDVFDAIEAVFPCGSITGAPKRRAMEILASLEPAPRGVYTGAVGWVGFDRSAELAVAIRSGMIADGVFSFGAGGGIVADSKPEAEWEELQLKAHAIRLALGASREPIPGPGGSR